MVKTRQNIFQIWKSEIVFINSFTCQFVDSRGIIIRGAEDIRKEMYEFYSKLYEPRESSDVDLDGLLNYNDIPKLTHSMSEMLEGHLD